MEHQDALKELLLARNFSLQAHGFEPVAVGVCAELRELVLNFLDIADVYGDENGCTKVK